MNLKSIVFILFISLNLNLVAQEVQWRGPNRDGKYPDTNLLQEWPDGGPKRVLLKGKLGSGYASPVVYNDVIYITGRRDSFDVLTALTMKGDVLWETTIGKSWPSSYPDSRSTPTIENNRIYVTASLGTVNCINAETGEIIWAVNTHEKYKGEFHIWGMAESILLTETAVISSPTGKETAMVALSKVDGSLIWKTKSMGDVRSYASPLLIEYNGVKQIVGITSENVLSVNPETGDINWSYNLKKGHAHGVNNINTNTPLYHDGEIYVTRGYNAESVMLKMAEDSKSVSLKWSNKALDTHHGGVVLLDGYIYGSNWLNNGKGNWLCQEWETGKIMYEEKWHNKGQIIFADKRLYIYEEKQGNVGLIEPNPSKFILKGTFKIDEGNGPHWGHPTIYNGYLLIRHGKALMIYDIRKDRS